MGALRISIGLSCLFLFASSAPGDELSLEATKFKFEVRLEQLEKATSEKLGKAYRARLVTLRDSYRKDGNLSAVLEIDAVTKALDAEEPAPATTLPQLAQLRDTYDRAKAKAAVSQAAERKPLYAAYLKRLLAIEAKGGPDTGAATEEIAAVKEILKGIDQTTRFVPGTRIRGRMHLDVDDKVTFYINGEKWWDARRSPKNKGKFVSPVLELTVGEHLLASVRNSGGGLRHVKFIFVAENESDTIEFRVADFADLKQVLGDRREFTKADLESEQAIPARMDADKFGNPFDFENGSEWVWGKGNHSLLATVISPQMCQIR